MGIVLHGRPIVPVRAVVVQRTGRVGVTVADSGKLQMSKLKRADVYKSDERRKTYTALPVFQRTMGVSFADIENRVVNSLADTAHAKSVRLVGVVRIHTAAIEVHVVCVGRIVLCRRPIAPVRTGDFERTGRVVTLTDSGKLQLSNGS